MTSVEMDTSDLLMNLEYFLRDQRLKLNNDKEKLEKSNSPRHTPRCDDGIKNIQQTKADFPDFLKDPERKYHSSTCQTDLSLPNSTQTSSVATETESMLDHPKYGLPGIGEFQDQHKIQQLEQKRQLNEILSEAIRLKEQERQRKTRSAPVDYEDLLTRKREEEANYRYYNNLGPLSTRDAYSGGYLDNKPLRNNYLHQQLQSPGYLDTKPLENNYLHQQFQSSPAMSSQINSRAYVDELASLLSRLQMHTELDRSNIDRMTSLQEPLGLPIYKQPDLTSYYSNTKMDMIPEKDIPRALPSNFKVGAVPQGNDDQRKTLQGRQRSEIYRLELEAQIREQKERKKRILADERADIIGNSLPGFFSFNQNPAPRNIQSDLLKQIEDSKLRKYQEKEWEAKQEKEWEAKQVNDHQAVLIRAQEESVHTNDGVRKVPDKWHDGHWPLPENKESERRKLNYQEELKLQIEEKKRREREEKEAQRAEEERLARKFEEQRKIIQLEFEAEQKRQRQKEEESRLKTELLARDQGRQRQEQERKRKIDSEKEWWERKEEQREHKPVETKKFESPCVTHRPSSPLVPALQRTRVTPTDTPRTISSTLHTPRIVQTTLYTHKSSQEHSRLSPKVTTRTNVLGQLSAMRRQLQEEQQRIEKRNENDDYQVFDARLQRPLRLRSSSRRPKSFTICDSIDVDDIAVKNQQRLDRIKEWQSSGDYESSLSDR